MTTEFSVAELHAPEKNGLSLQLPNLDDVPTIWNENRQRFEDAEIQFGDVSLAEFRAIAQRELIDLALESTNAYLDCDFPKNRQQSVLLSGHQPELFHPGIWYKNFVLSSLGQKLDCVPIHINIDTELCRSTSIKVPDGLSDTKLIEVPFDAKPSERPFELAKAADQSVFCNFVNQIRKLAANLNIQDPIVNSLWNELSLLPDSTDLLSQQIANSRHRLEQKHGLQTLEVNLSEIAKTHSFARFTAAILADLPRFVKFYNNALHRYRVENRLRSKSHPAPDLETLGSEFETPFWIYDEVHERQALRVKFGEKELTIQNSVARKNVHSCRTQYSDIANLIYELNQSGISIRPRALMTTMYARLILSNCFIHGIGGAKYDRVTDQIMQDWLGLQPPSYIVSTATFHLPLQITDTNEQDVLELEKQAKQFQFHPEKLLDSADMESETQALIAEKQNLFQQKVAKGQGKQRHLRIEEINSALQDIVADKARSLAVSAQELRAQLIAKTILRSREFSFCLFPEELIANLKELTEV